MKDSDKTKEQLIAEAERLKSRFGSLEKRLNETEVKYRFLYDSQPFFNFIVDTSGNILDVNRVVADTFGFSESELVGKPFLDFVIPEHREKTSISLEQDFRGEDNPAIEVGMYGKDGAIHSILFSASQARLIDKVRVSPILVTGIDITERKLAEEVLRRSEEHYQLLAENAADVIWVVDMNMELTYVSPSVTHLIGYNAEEAMTKKMREVFTPASFVVAMKALTEELAIGNIDQKDLARSRTLELELNHKDDYIVPVEVNYSFLHRPDGRPIQILAIARDITERKQAEAEKRELERKAQVTSRLASVGEMASGIAHEINNPLTGVVGFSELLLEKDLPEDLREEVEIIHDGAQRVADIVKRLLTFARQHKPERTCTDINQIIESTLALRKYALETGNIEVSTSLDTELPWTMADRGQLQQVFMNIIVNAETEMKKAHGRGKLIVKTERIDNKIRLSFKDDGPGIARENIGKVFDPFFTTKEVGEGTGLGLSLSHGIITEHKGAMYAESEVGEGATFIIELPIVAEEEEKIETVEAAEEAGKPRGGRILVVDDEPTILTFLKEVLGGEGYEVATAGSGEEALGMIKNERYGLILCDIKLPGLSGVELYDEIKKVAPSLQKRVIFITGDVTSADTSQFLKRTKAPYVTKPFDIARLKEEVKRAIAGAG